MKRAHDPMASLPVNPLNGLPPTIDPISHFNPASSSTSMNGNSTHSASASASANANANAMDAKKRPRHSPMPLPLNAAAGNFHPGLATPLSASNAGMYSPFVLPMADLASPPTGQMPLMPFTPNIFSTPINMGMSMGMGMGLGVNVTGWTPGPAIPYMMQSPFAPSLHSPAVSSSKPTEGDVSGVFGAAAASAAIKAATNLTGRTVYIGNIPQGDQEPQLDELLSLIHFGPIEQVKVVRIKDGKTCVFVSFLNGATAAAFYADAGVKMIALRGQQLRMGWGVESEVSNEVKRARKEAGATRCVFLGGITNEDTEETLKAELQRFGDIDQVKIVRDKSTAFVHFLSIGVAIKVVRTLSADAKWATRRVAYGSDRCAYVPKAQRATVQANIKHALLAAQGAHVQQLAMSGIFLPEIQSINNLAPAAPIMSPTFSIDPFNQFQNQFPTSNTNRTLYLGNLDPETTYEDICNIVRGGIVHEIKLKREETKCNAFVSFVFAEAASRFHDFALSNPITLRGRNVRVGWGTRSTPLSEDIPRAIMDPGNTTKPSRNIYVGKIPSMDMFTEEKLRSDFDEYGIIEMVNFLPLKNCAFVNFTSIDAAAKAVKVHRATHEDYKDLVISFGKDRCEQSPRANGTPSYRMTPQQSRMNGTHIPFRPAQTPILNGNSNGNGFEDYDTEMPYEEGEFESAPASAPGSGP